MCTRPGGDHTDVTAFHTHPIQQGRLLLHPHQAASQHDWRVPGITQAPYTITQIVNAIAAFDAEGKAQFLAQPVFVQSQSNNIHRFNSHRPAVRATAYAPMVFVRPHLRTVLLAVRAQNKRVIDDCRLDRFAQSVQDRCLSG